MLSSLPFNRPYTVEKELTYIAEAHGSRHLSGDGSFTRRCHQYIERLTGCERALLTHSCTSALEMAAILLDIKDGDEIICPSYTFVSTANAFVLRGGVPVFVDVREDTMNLNEDLIESAISPRTKAIVVVHYAGIACEMDAIAAIASKYGLAIVEDAAQGIGASYKGRPLGAFGSLAAFSFHETKNISSGEGGCLLLNEKHFIDRAEIIREKGTDRTRFFRGEVDKYTWRDVGSSFLPGEVTAASLMAQLEQISYITSQRRMLWDHYHNLLATLEQGCFLRRPTIPDACEHNGHIYYVLLSEKFDREIILRYLRSENIHAISHYVPLHSSPGGQRFGKAIGSFAHTDRASKSLIRLPMWIGLRGSDQERIVGTLRKALLQN